MFVAHTELRIDLVDPLMSVCDCTLEHMHLGSFARHCLSLAWLKVTVPNRAIVA
jgi:hypothetical protein